jgi:hypothetical protein
MNLGRLLSLGALRVNPREAARLVFSVVSGPVVRPLFADMFRGQSAAYKRELAGKFRRLAERLEASDNDGAAGIAADVVDDIRF